MAFEDALAFTLRWEGGLADNPADHGGKTYKGITQRVYNNYRLSSGHTIQDVALASDEEIREIYKEGYWDTIQGDKLPELVAVIAFDCAVNHGPERAIRFIQTALGIDVDGSLGPKTFAALGNITLGTQIFLKRLCDVRKDFYRKIVTLDPSQATFLKGWLARTDALARFVGAAV